MVQKTSILKMNFVGFLVVIFILTSLLGGSWIIEEYNHLEKGLDRLEGEFIRSRKEQMKQNVGTIIENIKFEENRTEKRVQDELRKRVVEACTLAMTTWQENQGRLSKEEIQRLIVDSLKGIRLDNGFGYYFAASSDGREMIADNSELAARKLHVVPDASVEAIVRGMVRPDEERFIRYMAPKPNSEIEQPKLSFVKHFEPFGWDVGAGVYLGDLKRDIQTQILEWLFSMQFEPDSAVYVLSYDGTVLFHNQNQYIGRNILTQTNPEGREIYRELLDAGRYPAGRYLSYVWEKPETQQLSSKIAFARAHENWGWIIATDMYTDDVEVLLGQEKASLKRKVVYHLIRILFLFLGFVVFVVLLSHYFSVRLHKEFMVFNVFFQNAARAHQKIDRSSLSIQEFQQLAQSANKMISDRKQAEDEIIRLNKELEKRVAERTAQLEASNKDLESVNRELQEFAYVVSHDLKAPLRGISQLAGWISQDYHDALDEAGKEQMKLLMGRVKRMNDLIDGILRYSRLGRNREKIEPIDLNALVSDALEMLSLPEHIRVIRENDLPVILGEKVRIEQVFQNLLNNAVKFMDKSDGEIKIGCTDQGACWRFYIADNGPGIESRHYEKIFEMFQTLRSRDDIESTGIGLTLGKKIVESYGGRIWVESVPGEGSTFFFTLPKTGRENEKQKTDSSC